MSDFKSQFAQQMEDMIELRIALGYSENTYRPRLKRLDQFISENYAFTNSFSRELVEDWVEVRSDTASSKSKYRADIARLFGQYLCAIGCDAYVIPVKFIVRKRKFAPHIMTDSELKAFFNEVDKTRKTSADVLRRQTASVMLRLIYTCGLRPGEGLRLKSQNVNLETGEILIAETKLKKDRIVVMHDDMRLLMRKYAAKQALVGRNSLYFFTGPSGQPYTSEWLDRVVKGCVSRMYAGVDSQLVPRVRVYDLRHRFASAVLCRWLDEERNLYNMLPYLSTYMGHKTLAQTAYYIHVLPENLLKAHSVDWDKLNDVIPEAEEWED